MYAVLTGDIINSSKLSILARKVLIDSLGDLFNDYRQQSDNLLNLQITSEMYRGDSFQCLLDVPEQALRIALLIRTFLQSKILLEGKQISSDARIAIGVGGINRLDETLAKSDGEVFLHSGRLLDTLKKHPNKIAFKSSNISLDAEMNTALVLLEGIINKWTPLQAEAVYYKLQGYTEVVIADILNVKQPSINQRSKAAFWEGVECLLDRFQYLLTE